MSEIYYPSRSDLEWWVGFLREENTTLKLKLPAIDEEWYRLMLSAIERIHVIPVPMTLYEKGAQLFYNIAKGHSFVDGNKRSSIVVIYVFFLVNDKFIKIDVDMGDLAKKVARSIGRARHDFWIEKLADLFEEGTEPF